MSSLRTTALYSLIFILLGTMLLSGCAQTDAGAGEEKDKLTLIGQDAISVRWSPDGARLAVVTRAGYLAIYEQKDGKLQFSNYADKRTGFINGRSLAWGADNNTVYYYDRPIDAKTQEPAPLEYGSLLMSVDATSGKVTNVHPQFIESVSSMDATPDGSQLMINTYEERKYGIATFQLNEGIYQDLAQPVAADPAGDSRLSRDGRQLFVNERLADADQYQGVISELATGQKRIISDHYLSNVSFSPDGRWLAYVGDDHTVFIISADKPGEAAVIAKPAVGAESLDWSPLGDRIALTAQADDEKHSMQLYLLEVPQSYQPDAKSQ